MKKIISILLAVLTIVCLFASCGKSEADEDTSDTDKQFVAENLSDGTFDYVTLPDGTAAVTGYKANPGKGDLYIPEFIGSITVSVIQKGAFKDCDSIYKIYTPKSLIAIEDEAFMGSSLYQIFTYSSKNLKTIGANAFANCEKLVQADIVSSVESIGKGAFSNCKALMVLTLRGDITLNADMFTGAKKFTIWCDKEAANIIQFAKDNGYDIKNI